MTAFLQFGLANAIWLFVLGGALFLVSRKWLRFAPAIHLLWVLILIKILLPPMINVELGMWNAELTVDNAELGIGNGELTVENAEFHVPNVEQNANSRHPENNFDRSASPIPHPQFRIPNSTSPISHSPLIMLGTLWFVGSLVVLTISLSRIAKFWRHVKNMEPADEKVQNLAVEIGRKLGLARKVTVYQLSACVPPMVWAFCSRPKILFPKALLEQLGDEQTELLLSHELAHIKRGDHLVRYLELICTIVYWWHPMLWLARRELREAEELCCDAWTTWLFPEKSRNYGHALMNTIDYLAEQKPLTLPITGSGMSLKETKRRIEMILRANLSRKISWPIRILLLILAVVILPLSATLVAKQAPPQEKQNETIQQPLSPPRETPPEPEAVRTIDTPPDDGHPQDIVWQEVTCTVVDEATGQPMPNIPVTLVSKRDNGAEAEYSFTTDQNGKFMFRYPWRVGTDYVASNVIKAFSIRTAPIRKDGRVLIAPPGETPLPRYTHVKSKPEGDLSLTFRLVDGHLLVGRVVNAETYQPLLKTDDGKPIRVGLSPIGWNERGLLIDFQHPREVTEVDANGIFQFYVPEGVCLPFLLDNGADKIWKRTENHEQWEKEGILVKPGKITTVEFRVNPRLDSTAPSASLPVPEEQNAAAKFLVTAGTYELNSAGHVEKVITGVYEPTITEALGLLSEFPQLRELTIELASSSGGMGVMGNPSLDSILRQIKPETWKKLENIPMLEKLTILVNPAFGDNITTYNGKQEIRKFLEQMTTGPNK